MQIVMRGDHGMMVFLQLREEQTERQNPDLEVPEMKNNN